MSDDHFTDDDFSKGPFYNSMEEMEEAAARMLEAEAAEAGCSVEEYKERWVRKYNEHSEAYEQLWAAHDRGESLDKHLPHVAPSGPSDKIATECFLNLGDGAQQREKRHEELVVKAKSKPTRRFLQFDGWTYDELDLARNGRCLTPSPDGDGDVVLAVVRWELRNTDFPVRVQIREGGDKASVLRLLHKTVARLEREGEFDALMEFVGADNEYVVV